MFKGIRWLILPGVSFLLACGSPYTHTTTQAEIEAAASDFGAIVDDCMEIFDEMPAAETKSCNCPINGSVTLNTETREMTVSNCMSATNKVFNGTMTRHDDNSIDVNMSEFGNCNNVTGSDVGIDPDTRCGGEVTMTCVELGQTCTYSDPSAGSDRCSVACAAHRT